MDLRPIAAEIVDFILDRAFGTRREYVDRVEEILRKEIAKAPFRKIFEESDT